MITLADQAMHDNVQHVKCVKYAVQSVGSMIYFFNPLTAGAAYIRVFIF